MKEFSLLPNKKITLFLLHILEQKLVLSRNKPSINYALKTSEVVFHLIKNITNPYNPATG